MSTDKATTTQQTIQEFIEKAKQQTRLLDEGDADSANMLEKDMGNIYRGLRAAGRAEQEALLPLLEHADASVRAEAAQFVLDFEPARALPVLEALAAVPRGGTPRMNAHATLLVWRDGSYRIA